MQVFAPAAFRYPPQTGKDYPYGLQDIADASLVETLAAAGFIQRMGAGVDPNVPAGMVQVIGTPAQAAAFPGLVSGDGIVRVIGQSAVPIAHTGTTVATSLAIIPVPANVMGPNGALRVSVWWSMTNNANSKNLNIRWGNGNTTIWSAGLASWAAAAGQVMVCNRGNAGSQLASATGTTAVFGQLPGFVTASEDTTIDQRIQITATLANAADTLTIERYLVEVLR